MNWQEQIDKYEPTIPGLQRAYDDERERARLYALTRGQCDGRQVDRVEQSRDALIAARARVADAKDRLRAEQANREAEAARVASRTAAGDLGRVQPTGDL